MKLTKDNLQEWKQEVLKEFEIVALIEDYPLQSDEDILEWWIGFDPIDYVNEELSYA